MAERRGKLGNATANQRRFLRSDIRRRSFALIAQQLGLTLGQIEVELATLPEGRTPTRADWREISERIKGLLDDKIATLQRMRDRLDGCIGCGCLSLEACALYNPDDRARRAGPGPRFVITNESA